MEWDFVEKATIDESVLTTDCPEAYRGYYIKGADGKFAIDAKIKPLADAYSGVNKRLGGVTKDKTNFSKEAADRRAQLKSITDTLTEMGIEPGDDVATTLRTKITEMVEQTKSGKELTTQLAKIKDEHTKKLNEAIAAKDIELSSMTKSMESHMIQRDAASALAEAKVVKGGVDLLMPQIMSQTKMFKDEDGKYVVRVVDGQGDMRSNGRGGWMEVKDIITELRTNYPMTFESASPSGGGARPGAASRPVGKTVDANDMTPIQQISAGLAARRAS